MREIIIGLAGCGAVFGWFVSSGNMPKDNVYSFTLAQAQNRLASASTMKGDGPFGDNEITVSKPSANHVRWMAARPHSRAYCDATIETVEANKVRVTNTCFGGSDASDGVTAGNTEEIQKVKFNEFVDATMDGRAYDKKKIDAAVLAISAKNYPSMLKDALKMDMEMQKMTREHEAKAAATSPAPYKPSAPSTDYTMGGQAKFGEPTAMGQPSAPAASSGFGQPTQ